MLLFLKVSPNINRKCVRCWWRASLPDMGWQYWAGWALSGWRESSQDWAGRCWDVDHLPHSVSQPPGDDQQCLLPLQQDKHWARLQLCGEPHPLPGRLVTSSCDIFQIVIKWVAHSVATPALLCHKEPAQGTQSPLLGALGRNALY